MVMLIVMTTEVIMILNMIKWNKEMMMVVIIALNNDDEYIRDNEDVQN